MSWSQRVHVFAGTLALFGLLVSFLDASEAPTAAARQAPPTWQVEIDAGRKGQKHATLSFPDVAMTIPVDLDGGSALRLTLESQNAPRLASLRFADGLVAKGFLMQSGQELRGKLGPAEKPARAERDRWRHRADIKSDWKSPLANAPLEIKPGPASDLAYRKVMPTVKLEAHEGDHEH